MAREVLRAAYPIIREELIAEIVERLKCGMGDEQCPWQMAANFIEREFGQGS